MDNSYYVERQREQTEHYFICAETTQIALKNVVNFYGKGEADVG